jgi:hypothetical protein
MFMLRLLKAWKLGGTERGKASPTSLLQRFVLLISEHSLKIGLKITPTRFRFGLAGFG